MFQGVALAPNHCRFRISPDVVFAPGVNVLPLGAEAESQTLELLVSRAGAGRASTTAVGRGGRRVSG